MNDRLLCGCGHRHTGGSVDRGCPVCPDAYVCHEDEGVVHVEYPTGYIVIGEGHVTGPYLTREQAEAELTDPAKQDPAHVVKPMYSGWIEPTDVVAKEVA